jgi:hypothetical protein
MDEYNRLRYKERKSMSNPLLKHIKIIDKISSKEMAVSQDGKTQKYMFNMNGSTSREFELVVEVDEVSVVAKKSDKKVKKSARRRSMQKNESFDLSKPPMIENIK